MELFVVGIFLWFLIGLSAVLFIWGIWKRSWKALAWSGTALLPPMLLIFMGGSGIWFRLCIVPPLLLLAGAYYMKHHWYNFSD
ncbi:hypothetical protein [Planococcus salinus]|uniref:Uncharacterized protein n=1 Tax=Planococcus salinus TaxID=1848460 RepID=A0A3M8P8F5_9BACL|nr:hypothetical protein [Planococcus salinus]RNF39711.1 hypothetical protein EEX84_07005 [Planococcus salinus]